MTQGELAEAMYGDKNHIQNIYASLQALVRKGIVVREGARPAFYSLSDTPMDAEFYSENRKGTRCFSTSLCNHSAETAKSVIDAAKRYYLVTQNDKNGRYRSWEHCYAQFAKARKEHETDYDQLSLHLAFYLASWGMYRGSSFLLQKDYKVHIPAVQEILRKKYDSLFGMRCLDIQDTSNQSLLEELGNTIRKYYETVRKSIESKQTVEQDVSAILITKVLLGTLGCVPAYDQFFVKGIRKKHAASGIYNTKSLLQLAAFYESNHAALELFRSDLRIEEGKLQYPQMKLLDMGFWQIGIENT